MTLRRDKPYSREIDSVDREILLLIIKGCSSAYSVQSAMKKEVREKGQDEKRVMSYVNINKKISELVRMGLLEELKPSPYSVNVHGRKDYSITKDGIQHLIPRNKDDVRIILGYVNEHYPDYRFMLGYYLVDRFVNSCLILNEYLEGINHEELVLVRYKQIDSLVTSLRDLERGKYPLPVVANEPAKPMSIPKQGEVVTQRPFARPKKGQGTYVGSLEERNNWYKQQRSVVVTNELDPRIDPKRELEQRKSQSCVEEDLDRRQKYSTKKVPHQRISRGKK